ncbi:MAG TPA: hypothetical protein VI670_09935 [Thermoanaerobaculia bacterium]|jgi:hypothetical protein
MPRIASLFALLLVCSPLAAAETVTAELPVSDLRLVPDPYAGCSVFSGATKAFAVCAYAGGGQPYRYDLESDGSPILSSRVPIDAQASAAAGDALFYAALLEDAVVVHRFGSDVEARIDTAAATQPALVWNGGGLLLLLYTSGGTMKGTILDTELHVAVPPFAVMPAASWTRASSAGGGFLIAGHDSAGGVTAVIVNSNGGVRPVGLPAPRVSYDAIASNGNEYLYVWQRDRTPAAAQRYTASGEAAGDLQVVAQSGSGNLYYPSAVWTGSDFLISWSDNGDGWIRTLNGPPQPAGKGIPSLAAGPAGVFVTRSAPHEATVIRRLDTDGPEHVLDYTAAAQTVPILAVDGLDAAVVWNEGSSGEVRFGRTRVDGTHHDGTGTVLPVKAIFPRMAFDGTSYLIVWVGDKRVNGLFVGRDGRVTGAPFVIADEPYAQIASITWTGTTYLVTWQSGFFRLGAGAAVTPAGSITPFQFGSTESESSASAGPRTLVVSANSSPDYVYMKVTGVFLDAAGAPFDIVRELNTTDSGFFGQVHAVSNGRDYLVTWTRHTANHAEAWIARIDDRGRVIGAPLQAAATDASWHGAGAIPLFDGANYRVVVGGDTAMPLYVATVTDATFACRCLDDRVAVPIDFDIAKQGRYFEAAASREAIVIAYEHAYPHDPPRTFVRFVRTPPAPRRRAAGR